MRDTRQRDKDQLKILGALRLLVTLVLSWVLVVRLTPPGKPVENGLEVLFPGAVVLLLGVPYALAGVALITRGKRAIKAAVLTNAWALAVLGYLFGMPSWMALAALPFAADLATLAVIAKR